MKILITGGLGFIGSNLARRLATEQHDITLLDSLIPEYGGNLANIAGIEDKVRVNISDLRDPYATRTLLEGVNLIFNLAGQTSHLDSMTDPFTDLEINARSQLSLLEAVRDVCSDATVIFASTRQIYGRPQYLPVNESHPSQPVDINGINKLAGEQFHLLYHKIHNISTVALRLTNTYGPRMRIKDARQTFLGIWIRQLLSNKTVLVYGDGKQLRDFNYVDDVVEALILAAMNKGCHGKVINLGSPEVISLAQLAEIVCDLEASSTWQLVPFPSERLKIDIGDYYSNFQLAEELLGWCPKVQLSEGLAKTVSFYRRNLDVYL